MPKELKLKVTVITASPDVPSPEKCERLDHEDTSLFTNKKLEICCPHCIAWAKKKLKKINNRLNEIGTVEAGNIMLEIRQANVPKDLRLLIIKALTGKSPTANSLHPYRYGNLIVKAIENAKRRQDKT